MELVNEIPRRFSGTAVDHDGILHLTMNDQHTRLFEAHAQFLDIEAYRPIVDVNRRSVVEEIKRAKRTGQAPAPRGRPPGYVAP